MTTFTVRKYRFHPGMTLTSFTVLWRIDPLLRGDSVNNSRCYATREQTNDRFCATAQILLDYNNGNGVFYVVRAEML
jgi:hypothetical protein